MILTSTTESKLKEVAAECVKRSKNQLKPEDVLVCAYDISDYKKNDEALKKALDRFGNVDIVVNNAARIFLSKIVDDDMEQQRKLFDINYLANIYIAKMMVRQ